MTRRVWVRGKALQTVLGLKALQPGDELLIDINKCIPNRVGTRTNWAYRNEPFVFEAYTYDDHSVQGSFVKSRSRAHTKDEWTFDIEQIRAWRRP